MAPHVDTLLGRLQSVSPVKDSVGRIEYWTALCPCSRHEAEGVRLHIGLDPDEKIMLFCQGSCNPADILRSVGLRESDLYPPLPRALPALPLATPVQHSVADAVGGDAESPSSQLHRANGSTDGDTRGTRSAIHTSHLSPVRNASPERPVPVEVGNASMLLQWLREKHVTVLRPSDGVLYVRVPVELRAHAGDVAPPTPCTLALSYPADDPLLYSQLAAAFYLDTGGVVCSTDLFDVCLLLSAIEGENGSSSRPLPIARRFGFSDGTLYVDLADNAGSVVAIGSSGWRLTDRCPITFVRTSGMLPLPMPCSGGALELLRDLLCLPAGPTWVAVRAWLVGTLLPYGPVPPLLLREHDPVRTTHLAHLLTWVLDPHRQRSANNTFEAASYARPFILRADLYDGAHAHLAALDEIGRFDRPGSGRMVLTDRSRIGYASELRRRCLVLDPCFVPWAGPRSTLPSQVASVHAAVLGAVFDAASEAMRCYASTWPRGVSASTGYASFLRWVTAAEAAMAPSTDSFQELWEDAAGRTHFFFRWLRRLRRRVYSVCQPMHDAGGDESEVDLPDCPAPTPSSPARVGRAR